MRATSSTSTSATSPARRWLPVWPPEPIDPAVVRAVELTHDPETEEDLAPTLKELREDAEGMAASEEELLLLGLFGADAERLLQNIRSRASSEEDGLASVDKARAE